MGVRHDGFWALLIVALLAAVIITAAHPGALGEGVGEFVAGLVRGYQATKGG